MYKIWHKITSFIVWTPIFVCLFLKHKIGKFFRNE